MSKGMLHKCNLCDSLQVQILDYLKVKLMCENLFLVSEICDVMSLGALGKSILARKTMVMVENRGQKSCKT